MRYYLDTEFNGFGGALISLALIREDGASLYAVDGDFPGDIDPWVAANILPIITACPVNIVYLGYGYTFATEIGAFLLGDADPIIVTDWPDDVRHFCQEIITGPGQMIALPSIKFEVHRVDAYPTAIPGAVQHNAWWDAMALRAKLQNAEPPTSQEET